MNDKNCILNQSSLKFVPEGPINNMSDSDNGLAPNRPQVITWTNADPVHPGMYAVLEEDELNT